MPAVCERGSIRVVARVGHIPGAVIKVRKRRVAFIMPDQIIDAISTTGESR